MGLPVAAAAVSDAYSALGLAATYTPPGGPAVAVTAIPFGHDPPLELGEVSTHAPGWRVVLLVAEVPTMPPAGATIVLGGATYRLRSDATHGPQDAVWLCDTVKE